MTKLFSAERGMQMDANFYSHKQECTKCAAADLSKSAGIAALCLEGSILYKRETAPKHAPKAAKTYDPYRVSKAAAKAAVRYKGDPV